jgi:hypothetical protein
MTLRLGPITTPLSVEVIRNGTWWSTLQNTEGDWPDGISIELRFQVGEDPSAFVWVADIGTDMATWTISAIEVEDLVEQEPRVVSLWYIDPTLGVELPWAQGSVVIR